MTARCRRAFTLIELLVVVAIIAILAAILFPVFAQARDKARQASCLSNAKQLGLAINMYTQDYDETFFFQNSWDEVVDVGAGFWGPSYRTYIRWPMAHLPYVKNQAVFTCPSDKIRQGRSFNAGPCNGGCVPWPIGYGANLMIMVRDAGSNPSPVTMATIQRPADKIAIAEASTPYGCCEDWNSEYHKAANFATGDNGWTTNAQWRTLVGSGQATDAQMATVARHQSGNIAVYCDGHAKWNRWNSLGHSAAPASVAERNKWKALVNPRFDL